MCGCSANFVNDDEKEIITESQFRNDNFDFTGNRPSVIEVGEDPSFDFMGDLDGKTQFDDFLGKKAKVRRQERRLTKQGLKSGEVAGEVAGEPMANDDTQKQVYGTGGNWFSSNWHWLLIGGAVLGAGFYIYKKRK
jgi:LPXTG-motif cell wall-anchored protein